MRFFRSPLVPRSLLSLCNHNAQSPASVALCHTGKALRSPFLRHARPRFWSSKPDDRFHYHHKDFDSDERRLYDRWRIHHNVSQEFKSDKNLRRSYEKYERWRIYSRVSQDLESDENLRRSYEKWRIHYNETSKEKETAAEGPVFILFVNTMLAACLGLALSVLYIVMRTIDLLVRKYILGEKINAEEFLWFMPGTKDQ